MTRHPDTPLRLPAALALCLLALPAGALAQAVVTEGGQSAVTTASGADAAALPDGETPAEAAAAGRAARRARPAG